MAIWTILRPILNILRTKNAILIETYLGKLHSLYSPTVQLAIFPLFLILAFFSDRYLMLLFATLGSSFL